MGIVAVSCNDHVQPERTDRRAILTLRDELDRRIGVPAHDGVRSGQFTVGDPLVATRAITGMISFMWSWAHHLDSKGSADLAKQITRIAMRRL